MHPDPPCLAPPPPCSIPPAMIIRSSRRGRNPALSSFPAPAHRARPAHPARAPSHDVVRGVPRVPSTVPSPHPTTHRGYRAGMDLDDLRAVLFDMDGTLVDSDVAVERAWRTWSAEYGADPEAVLAVAHGRPSAPTVREARPDLDEEAVAAAAA